MSKFYISNENGDWWTIETNTDGAPVIGGDLYVIGESALKAVTDTDDLNQIDKLEREIKAHGEIVKVTL